MTAADRAQLGGLLQVLVFLVATLLGLWILTLLYGALLQPIADLALSMDAVQQSGNDTLIERVMAIVPYAGLALGIGTIVLVIVYAVFREQFVGRSGRRRIRR